MSKKREIITVSGHFSCDMDVIVNKKDGEEDNEITRRAELIVESHMKTIGVRGYAEFSTPAQQEEMQKHSNKWQAKRKREDDGKIKKRIAKAVAQALTCRTNVRAES